MRLHLPEKPRFTLGLLVGLSFAAGIAAAATTTLTLGANTGPGGVLTLFGSTSGSVTVQTAAAAGTSTLFQLPNTNGSSTNVLTTDGTGVTSWTAAGTGNVTLAGNNTFTGTNVTTPTTVAATGNIDLSATGGLCGKPLQYTGASAGTLTVLATAVPGCNVPVYPTSTGLATIAAAGSGTIVANTACTANPRTLGAHSVIWVSVQSNAGSAPVINVSGDCG